jgi:hypothetical protein
MFTIDPGMVLCIKYDRFNLDSGRNGEVINVVETNETTILQVMMVK